MTAKTDGHRLGDLAERHGLMLRGDPDLRISGVAPLATADATQLAFLANRKLRGQLADSRAGAVIIDGKTAEGFNGNVLLSANPHASFARIAADFEDKGVRLYGQLAAASADRRERDFFELLAMIEYEHFLSLRDAEEYFENPAAWFTKIEHPMMDGG